MINPIRHSRSIYKIVHLCIFILFVGFIYGQSALPENAQVSSVTSEHYDNTVNASKSTFYFIKEAPNDTYGFDIYSNGKIIIDHTNIPGRKSNAGFRSIISAENVAKYLVSRLRNGMGLAAITEDELAKLIVD